MQQVVQWFDLGGEIEIDAIRRVRRNVSNGLKSIQGLIDKLAPLDVNTKDSPEVQVSAAEFILEGLYAHKRIGRSEERVFTAGEKQPKHREKHFDREEPPFRADGVHTTEPVESGLSTHKEVSGSWGPWL